MKVLFFESAAGAGLFVTYGQSQNIMFCIKVQEALFTGLARSVVYLYVYYSFTNWWQLPQPSFRGSIQGLHILEIFSRSD